MKNKITLFSGLAILTVVSVGLGSPEFNNTQFVIEFSTAPGSYSAAVYNNVSLTLSNPNVAAMYTNLAPVGSIETVTTTVGGYSPFLSAVSFTTPIKNTPPYTGNLSLSFTAVLGSEKLSFPQPIPIDFTNGLVSPVALTTVTLSDYKTCAYQVFAATPSDPATVEIQCNQPLSSAKKHS